jgi:transketolase
LVFSDYMRAPIRLAAMMGLPVIYVFTHDSIGLGEDGPTHQPIEQLASLRAIPNLWVFRPADFVETVEAWQLAWARRNGPCVIALSRQAVHQIRNRDDVNLSEQGAYIILDNVDPKVTLFATGSEVGIAMSAASRLQDDHQISVRVVSVVCKDLFEAQDEYYRDIILYGSKLNVVIEAGVRSGWEGFLGANGVFFGMEEFGASAPYKTLYEHFGLTVENVIEKVLARV